MNFLKLIKISIVSELLKLLVCWKKSPIGLIIHFYSDTSSFFCRNKWKNQQGLPPSRPFPVRKRPLFPIGYCSLFFQN